MKKLVVLLCIGFAACKDKSNSTTTDSAPNTTNVQNVNGNQPDTMGGMQLDSRTSPDTTAHKDSMH